MDKAAETIFGFVSVLPGAYSTFRWEAIKGDPLNVFFKEMKQHGKVPCDVKNMYLAEDRILVLEILFHKESAYTL